MFVIKKSQFISVFLFYKQKSCPMGDAKRRFAVQNIDWDNASAQDLFVLLNSFSQKNGLINSVKVYLSNFGKERIGKERQSGPQISFETEREKKKNRNMEKIIIKT